jgi:hypothetical protein
MNQDSGQARSQEVSSTPWETIDADEPAAVSAHQTGSSTGAPPVTPAEARATTPTDPFDPEDKPPAETVSPVPSPAESAPEQSPVPLLNETHPISENPVGSSLRTISYPAEGEHRASPTLRTPNHDPATSQPRPEPESNPVGSAPRTAIFIPPVDGPPRTTVPVLTNPGEPVRTADPTSTEQSVRSADPTTPTIPPAIDEDLAEEAAVPAVIAAKSFFAQSIVDADVPSDESDAGDEAAIEPEPVWEDPEMLDSPAPQVTGASWTIPLLCAGIGLIACCIVIPQADANRRLAYEKMTLQADLQSVQKQVVVNDEFLKKVVDDPSLAERLAQRQLKRVRKGQHVLRLQEEKPQMSPFQITNVAPPPPPPPYKPIGGVLATLCYDARTRLYLMGTAMAMIACGLVMGATPVRK